MTVMRQVHALVTKAFQTAFTKDATLKRKRTFGFKRMDISYFFI
jgi:hypothetical protein